MAVMPPEERDHVWYHTIDLPDGTTSPGWFDNRDAPLVHGIEGGAGRPEEGVAAEHVHVVTTGDEPRHHVVAGQLVAAVVVRRVPVRDRQDPRHRDQP